MYGNSGYSRVMFDDDDDTLDEAPALNPQGDNSPAVFAGFTPVKELIKDVYELEPFSPVFEDDNDTTTTAADLQHLNNILATSAALLPHVRTIPNFCALSITVCKTIEMRRKVKKLPFGEPKEGGTSRKHITLED